MLPNFTIVICGAVLTVIMLAVTGSGLVVPETHTRIGEMPEIGRPMMQHMITEQAGQAQFAALEFSRRIEELGHLRDLAPSTPVAEPAPAVRDDEPAQQTEKETVQEPVQEAVAQEAVKEAVKEPAAIASADEVPDPAPSIVTAAAPAPPAEPGDAAPLPAEPRAPAGVDSIEAISPKVMIPKAMIPRRGATGPRPVAALADTAEVAPTVHLGTRLNPRLPQRAQPRTKAVGATSSRSVAALAATAEGDPAVHLGTRPNSRLPRHAQPWTKAEVPAAKPTRHATLIHHPQHRYIRRSSAVQGSAPNPFGPPGTPGTPAAQFR
jgi:hypothetical protein